MLLAHAQAFQLDFDSVQTGMKEMSGGDRILEAGLSPQQVHGLASSTEITPLGAMDLATSSSASNSLPAQQETSQPQEESIGGGGKRTIPLREVTLDQQRSTIPGEPQKPIDERPVQDRSVPDSSPIPSAGNVAESESPTPLHPGAPDLPSNDFRRQPNIAQETLADTLPERPVVPVYTIGSVAVEAGVLVRLGWIAHVKNLYAAIPAYESASVPFSGLLSAMRPGSVSVSTLVPAFVFPLKRRRRRISSDNLS